MRILVDGRSLAGGGPGRGVAHYTAALCEALAASGEDEVRVLLPGTTDALLAPAGSAPVCVRAPSRVLFASAALLRRPRLDALGGPCDVVWAPAPAPLALSPRVPFVLTVHDRSWEVRPGDFTPYERLWHRLARPRALAHRARLVVCDSAAVRDELDREWALRGRTRLVRPAPAVTPSGRHGGERRHLLHVGPFEPRKDPETLLAGFAVARARGLDAELLLVGAHAHAPGVRALGTVSDGELSGLYASARAVVIASRLEGFGLVAAEAAAHGTPVVASDLPVLRELLGDGARWFPPGDAQALANALVAPPVPPPVLDLSWERSARELRRVLAEAVAA